MSSKYPTVIDCLRELGQRIQLTHDPTCVTAGQKLQDVNEHVVSTKRPSDEEPASLTVNDVLMMYIRLKIIQERAAEVNKTALEVLFGLKFELQNQIDQIEQRIVRASCHVLLFFFLMCRDTM